MENQESKPFFVFDVESIGLHGEGYAVGFVVMAPSGEELEYGRFACDPSDAMGDDVDRAWVALNVPPITINCSSTNHMRVEFWKKWMEWKAKGAVMATDCGWPVEARFLIACIEWDTEARKWEGPYPLHEIASVLLAAGLDPTATFDRTPSESPKHDPLADARQSARLLSDALKSLANRQIAETRLSEAVKAEGFIVTGPSGDRWHGKPPVIPNPEYETASPVDVAFHPDAIQVGGDCPHGFPYGDGCSECAALHVTTP